MLTALAAGILAPACFWLLFYRLEDRYKPEPLASLGGSWMLGIAAGALCWQAYRLAVACGLPDPESLELTDRRLFLVHAIGFVGMVEEAAKFLPFWLVCMRLPEFDERSDGIVYASCIALGFASYENLFYLERGGLAFVLARAFASPLVHTLFSSIWGQTIARRRVEGRPWVAAGIGAWCFAALCHGLYDFATTDGVLRPAGAVLVLGLWLWQLWTMRADVQADRAAS